MRQITNGSRVLDVAAGAGEQSVAAAKRVGETGHVLDGENLTELVTDIMVNHYFRSLPNRSLNGIIVMSDSQKRSHIDDSKTPVTWNPEGEKFYRCRQW